MEKLEPKHIIPYLEHKVECSYLDYSSENKRMNSVLTGFTKTDGVETTYKRKRKSPSGFTAGDLISFDSKNNNIADLKFKLHLIPLSDLIKPEHSDIYGEFSGWDEEQMENSAFLKDDPIHVLPHHICVMLFKLHFDCFDLISKGLAKKK